MIDDRDAQRREDTAERVCDLHVFLRWLGDTSRMVMGEDDSGGMMPECCFDNEAGIDRSAGDCALVERQGAEDPLSPMPSTEVESAVLPSRTFESEPNRSRRARAMGLTSFRGRAYVSTSSRTSWSSKAPRPFSLKRSLSR